MQQAAWARALEVAQVGLIRSWPAGSWVASQLRRRFPALRKVAARFIGTPSECSRKCGPTQSQELKKC